MNVLAAIYIAFFSVLAIGISVALIRGPGIAARGASHSAEGHAARRNVIETTRSPAPAVDMLETLKAAIREQVRIEVRAAVELQLARPDIRLGGVLFDRGDSLYEANLSIEYQEDLLAGRRGRVVQALELERMLRR